MPADRSPAREANRKGGTPLPLTADGSPTLEEILASLEEILDEDPPEQADIATILESKPGQVGVRKDLPPSGDEVAHPSQDPPPRKQSGPAASVVIRPRPHAPQERGETAGLPVGIPSPAGAVVTPDAVSLSGDDPVDADEPIELSADRLIDVGSVTRMTAEGAATPGAHVLAEVEKPLVEEELPAETAAEVVPEGEED
ncbi:MAG: hypothetical protein HQL63_06850, partial [Magnetococcales bacterium]|nr:hypothetical protein [Magnetococcales bacterium]